MRLDGFGLLVNDMGKMIPFIKIRYTALLVCIVATVAAIIESQTVITNFREETK